MGAARTVAGRRQAGEALVARHAEASSSHDVVVVGRRELEQEEREDASHAAGHTAKAALPDKETGHECGPTSSLDRYGGTLARSLDR